MLLHQIIDTFELNGDSVRTDLIKLYKQSLLTYYSRLFNCEPVLLVTSVFNACVYGRVVPSNEISEAIEQELQGLNLSEEDCEAERETMLFNSIPLSKL